MYAFVKGVRPGPFGESIIRNRPRTFAELRHRAVEHIASEGEVCVKRTSAVPSRPRGPTRVQPVRVNETMTGRKKPEARRPYEARKPQSRGPTGDQRPARERARPARYNFVVELKDFDPAGNSNVEESLRSTFCPVYATASSAESPSEPSLASPNEACKTHRRRL